MTPYSAESGITIYHGDCWDIVPKLQRFAAAVTDPPYAETSLKWDKWVQGWPCLLIGHTETLWSCGSFAMFMEHATDFSDCKWKIAQDLIWEKHNGSNNATDRRTTVGHGCNARCCGCDQSTAPRCTRRRSPWRSCG
jgi:site-specific DNA-methyltransferase (adenine-specific)